MKVVDTVDLLNCDYDLKNIFFGYSDCTATPSYHFCKKGDRPFSRLFYIKEGGHSFSDAPDETPYITAYAGSILYIPSDFPYYSKWTDGDKIAFESIHFNVVIDGEEVVLSDNIIEIVSEQDNILNEVFAQLRREWASGLPGFESMCKAKLYELLRYIGMKEMKALVKSKFQSIYKGILYLENNYLKNISVAELADMCHVSEKTFSRLFVKYKGISPIKYQYQMRMKRACEILKTGGYSVSETANIVGFDDPAYFSRRFKQYVGVNPSSLITNGI